MQREEITRNRADMSEMDESVQETTLIRPANPEWEGQGTTEKMTKAEVSVVGRDWGGSAGL